MRYARIEHGKVVEIGEFDSIKDRFHPSLVWVVCNAEVTENWLWANDVFSPPPAPSLDDLKRDTKEQIKDMRAKCLGQFVRNAGIATVYDTNYEAAAQYKAGAPTYVCRNGLTAEQHCAQLGHYLGMTATQFADYVIAENRQASPEKKSGARMTEIEAEYLRLYYSAVDAMTEAELQAAPGNYQAFCAARM